MQKHMLRTVWLSFSWFCVLTQRMAEPMQTGETAETKAAPAPSSDPELDVMGPARTKLEVTASESRESRASFVDRVYLAIQHSFSDRTHEEDDAAEFPASAGESSAAAPPSAEPPPSTTPLSAAPPPSALPQPASALVPATPNADPLPTEKPKTAEVEPEALTAAKKAAATRIEAASRARQSRVQVAVELGKRNPKFSEAAERPALPGAMKMPAPRHSVFVKRNGAGRRSSLKVPSLPAPLPKLPPVAVEVLESYGKTAKTRVIPWEALKLDRVVANGAADSVSRGKFNFVDVAVKQILQSRSSAEDMLKVLEEVDRMKAVNHPNLITTIGLASDFDVHLGVVMDFMPTTLFSLLHDKAYIEKYRDHLSWKTSFLAIVQDIAHGMAHLHNRVNLMHRDLKPENVMITKGWVAKVGHFGEVAKLTEPEPPPEEEEVTPDEEFYEDFCEEEEVEEGRVGGCLGCFRLATRPSHTTEPGVLPSRQTSEPPERTARPSHTTEPEEHESAAPPPADETPPAVTSREQKIEEKMFEEQIGLGPGDVSDRAPGRRKSHLDDGTDDVGDTVKRRSSVVERRVAGTLAYLAPEASRVTSDPLAPEPGMPADVRTRSPSTFENRRSLPVADAPTFRLVLTGVVVWLCARSRRHVHAALPRRDP